MFTANRLTPKLKLPYEQIKGSFSQRQNASIELVDKFYKKLIPEFNKDNKISINKLQEVVDSFFEKKIFVQAKSCSNPNCDGQNDIFYSPYTGKINKMTIEIEEKNGFIDIKNLTTILHEFQHVSDQLHHPKFLAGEQYLTMCNLITKEYLDLIDDHLYKRESLFRDETDKENILTNLLNKLKDFLKDKSAEESILYIQDAKNTLLQEAQAYKTQRKYAKKLYKKHIKIKRGDLMNQNKAFMFDEKIALLKKLGFEIINAERQKFKEKLLTENKHP